LSAAIQFRYSNSLFDHGSGHVAAPHCAFAGRRSRALTSTGV
jgi:hypothetical protein